MSYESHQFARATEFQSNRAEIAQFNWLLHITSFFMLAFMAVAIVVAKLTTLGDAMYFVPILGIGWAWAMARYDYLMHRLGAYLEREAKSPWENSPERRQKLWMVALTDAFAIVPFATLVGYAEWALWSQQGQIGYVVITAGAFLAGIGMIVYAGTMFRNKKAPLPSNV